MNTDYPYIKTASIVNSSTVMEAPYDLQTNRIDESYISPFIPASCNYGTLGLPLSITRAEHYGVDVRSTLYPISGTTASINLIANHIPTTYTDFLNSDVTSIGGFTIGKNLQFQNGIDPIQSYFGALTGSSSPFISKLNTINTLNHFPHYGAGMSDVLLKTHESSFSAVGLATKSSYMNELTITDRYKSLGLGGVATEIFNESYEAISGLKSHLDCRTINCQNAAGNIASIGGFTIGKNSQFQNGIDSTKSYFGELAGSGPIISKLNVFDVLNNSSHYDALASNVLLSTHYPSATQAAGYRNVNLGLITDRYMEGGVINKISNAAHESLTGLTSHLNCTLANYGIQTNNVKSAETLYAGNNPSILTLHAKGQDQHLSRIADVLERNHINFEYNDSDRSFECSIGEKHVTIIINYIFNYTGININKSTAHLGPNIILNNKPHVNN